MLSAEKSQCARQHESEWSVTIHYQSLLCRYWDVIARGTRNIIDTNRQANKLFQRLPPETQREIQQVTQYHHPTITRLECFRQLRLAPKYHKKLLRTTANSATKAY
jgi:hypothetical protein